MSTLRIIAGTANLGLADALANTDTIEHRHLPPEIRVCSVAPLLAETIAGMHSGQSSREPASAARSAQG
ncbi:phosphoribosylpyrophosphate synthetase [Nocardia sp. GAS34]|uniref:hypothetical protein n=1 Tax=unclassified Nocardia TaxID=2637762 RepID=UPI003D1AC0BA